MQRECKEMKGEPKQGVKKTRRGRERQGEGGGEVKYKTVWSGII